MDIHFISTLTPDDEDRLAVMIFEAAKGILASLPISYKLKVHTTSNRVCEHEQLDVVDAAPEIAAAPAAKLRFRARGARSPRLVDDQM